jgi:hypothetical protein
MSSAHHTPCDEASDQNLQPSLVPHTHGMAQDQQDASTSVLAMSQPSVSSQHHPSYLLMHPQAMSVLSPWAGVSLIDK